MNLIGNGIFDLLNCFVINKLICLNGYIIINRILK